MKNLILVALMAGAFSCAPKSLQAQKTTAVSSFEKVIVSPHIAVVLVEGDKESVTIDNAKVTDDKINIEVVGETLRLYLDGAKVVTKSEKRGDQYHSGKRSIYNGTMATATITYKKIKALSIRGEEIVKCESTIAQQKLKLSIYGESKVYFKELNVQELTASIYGQSYLEVKSGDVKRQVYRAYGESEVNTIAMDNESTKITAYGESNFRVQVSGRLKVTCYGEATINYKGNADVNKGIIIGEAEVRKIG